MNVLYSAIIKQLRRQLMCVFFILLTYLNTQAQTPDSGKPVLIRGNVSAPDLKRAQVDVVIRTKNGGMVSVDSLGNYLIRTKKIPDTLKFEAVGYTTITRIVNRRTDTALILNVKMAPKIQNLDEVKIYTGYQQLKPNEINGAVSSINEKMLNARTGTNILDRLTGQSSGVILNVGKTNGNPQNTTGISIRGIGTINGPLDPLIVLDGFIYEGDINNINPFDVEDVSILKDAAAGSIWGARAGNGVIVITSKKGRYNQDVIVSFNANATVKELPDLNSFRLMNSVDYVDVEKILFEKGFFDNRITLGYQSLTPAIEILLAKKNNKITGSVAEEQLGMLKNTDVRKSYLNSFYTNALTQQYGVAMKGGSERNSYAISTAYDRVMDESYAKSDKINLRLTHAYKLSSKLTISTNILLTSANSNSGRPVYGSLYSAGRQPSYLSFEDAMAAPLPLAISYRENYTDTAGAGKLLDWNYYPTKEYKLVQLSQKRKEIFGSLSMSYKILPFLTADLTYQLQYQQNMSSTDYNKDSYYARNLINSFSQLNRSTGVVKYNIPNGGILRSELNNVNSSTSRFQLNGNKILGLHSLNAILGAEVRESGTSGNSNLYYGYQKDPLIYSNVDYLGYYPNFITGNSSQINSASILSTLSYRFISLYGNAVYMFKGKYTISGSFRKDGSNIFGANTNDKWKPLWSAGLGWTLSNESFYNVRALPLLRITSTFGFSGNVDLTRTASPVGLYGTNALTGLPYVRIRSINNPDLKWEQLSQFNVKVDFSTRKDRLRGSASFYIKKGSDLYGLTPFDYTAWGGASEVIRNVADMKGYGMDAELHSINLVKGALKWNTDLYFNFNQNKTVEYYRQNLTGIFGLLGAGTSITPIVGKPLYAIAAYKWAGLNAVGQPQGYLNGVISSDYTAMSAEGNLTGANIRYIGPASPVYFGSFINSVSFKNLTLSFNLSYRFGYYARKESISYYSLINSGIGNDDYSRRWQKPGDELITDVPAFTYPNSGLSDSFYLNSEVNVIKADHIRLDYINLSYQLNAGKWKFPFRSLDIYGNASSLGILWRANKFKIDPDYIGQVNPFKGYTLGLKGSF